MTAQAHDEHLGFTEQQRVTVGSGRVVFVIQSFGERANGLPFAELRRADGTSRFSELANLDRLHPEEPPA